MLDDTEIEKQIFNSRKNPISIYDVNINRIVISNKVPFGKKGCKYFLGYKEDEKGVPLCVMLPKMSRHRKKFDETK